MKRTLLFSLLAFLFVFSACKKDNSSPSTPTVQNISGVYRITALKGQVPNGAVQDFTSQLSECDKTSTWGFQQDGTFLFGGAATQSCQDPDFSGKWALSGKALTITANGQTTEYQVVSSDSKNLVVTVGGTINGASATLTFTFTKI